jgi:hypothetical protein
MKKKTLYVRNNMTMHASDDILSKKWHSMKGTTLRVRNDIIHKKWHDVTNNNTTACKLNGHLKF